MCRGFGVDSHIDPGPERYCWSTAVGVMGLAEYRAKWYGETLEQAQENLPEQAKVKQELAH